MDKVYRGDVIEGDATGVVQLNSPRPRPRRVTAVSTEPLTDGPYPYIGAANYERISVTIQLAAGEATVALEGTNGDPDDPDTTWSTLDTSSALDASLDPVGELLEYEGAVKYVRLAWTGGTSPTFAAEVYCRC